MINQFIIILNVFPIAHGGNTHVLLLFATTLSENSIINVLISKINLVIQNQVHRKSESGSQNRVLASGIINQIRSARYYSLLMVTGHYGTLQHVTDRYYSFLLLVITIFNSLFRSLIYLNTPC